MIEKQVWKFQLPIQDVAAIQMPICSQVLHVGVQNGNLCVWALVNPTADKTYRSFRIAGTGHSISHQQSWKHVGTVITNDGALVLHVFDMGEQVYRPETEVSHGD